MSEQKVNHDEASVPQVQQGIFLFIFDSTQSMGRYIDGGREALSNRIEVLRSTDLICIVIMRDIDQKHKREPGHLTVLQPTNNKDEIKEFMKKYLFPEGGGDIPEDLHGAIGMGISVMQEYEEKNGRCRFFLIVITDAPTHGYCSSNIGDAHPLYEEDYPHLKLETLCNTLKTFNIVFMFMHANDTQTLPTRNALREFLGPCYRESALPISSTQTSAIPPRRSLYVSGELHGEPHDGPHGVPPVPPPYNSDLPNYASRATSDAICEFINEMSI